MRRVPGPELLPPRLISLPPGVGAPLYAPWVEVSLWIAIAVPKWRHRDDVWVHWGMATVKGVRIRAEPW